MGNRQWLCPLNTEGSATVSAQNQLKKADESLNNEPSSMALIGSRSETKAPSSYLQLFDISYASSIGFENALLNLYVCYPNSSTSSLVRAVAVPSPKYVETILCLANSRRPGGACVAGKKIESDNIGDWVRPINAKHGNSISAKDAEYKD